MVSGKKDRGFVSEPVLPPQPFHRKPIPWPLPVIDLARVFFVASAYGFSLKPKWLTCLIQGGWGSTYIYTPLWQTRTPFLPSCWGATVCLLAVEWLGNGYTGKVADVLHERSPPSTRSFFVGKWSPWGGDSSSFCSGSKINPTPLLPQTSLLVGNGPTALRAPRHLTEGGNTHQARLWFKGTRKHHCGLSHMTFF